MLAIKKDTEWIEAVETNAGKPYFKKQGSHCKNDQKGLFRASKMK